MADTPKTLHVSAGPHITGPVSTRSIMGAVLVALLPTAIASGFIFGWRAWAVIAVTTAACVLFEWLYCLLMKKPNTIGDVSAVVTGVILAFNLPSTIPFWIAVIGAFVAIVVTKQLFGGIGCNFANPALVGRIVLFIGFTGRMTAYGFPVDATAGATPLVQLHSSTGAAMFKDLFLGTTGGVLGETCALTLILGGIFLVVIKVISPIIPLAYVGTVAVFSLVLGQDVLGQVFAGGLLLGAIFMATDYTTSPFTKIGKVIYGIFLGLITCLIRFYGSYAEGVSFALLLGNILVPYINNLTRQKPLGGAKAK